jgi:uncharacterized protein involved in exopolysaccharide biosynthesis
MRAAKRNRSKVAKRNQSNSPDVRPQPDPDHVQPDVGREDSSTSFCTLGAALFRHRRFAASLMGGLSIACVLYCLIAPNEYEASARIALRSSPTTALILDGTTGANSNAFGSEQTQLETLEPLAKFLLSAVLS